MSTNNTVPQADSQAADLALLVALIKTHGITDVTELLAQACNSVAELPETDGQDADFLRAAQFHLTEAARAIYAC